MPRESAEKRRREEAEGLAVAALAFLAADDDRLSAFLAATGLDPGDVRAAAGQPGFAAGVLDHIASSDELMLAFAAHVEQPPERVAAARMLMAGPPPDWP
ncbi:MAG TPA: DUF3572 family protein [Beijerinckiaceae bacterium]